MLSYLAYTDDSKMRNKEMATTTTTQLADALYVTNKTAKKLRDEIAPLRKEKQELADKIYNNPDLPHGQVAAFCPWSGMPIDVDDYESYLYDMHSNMKHHGEECGCNGGDCGCIGCEVGCEKCKCECEPCDCDDAYTEEDEKTLLDSHAEVRGWHERIAALKNEINAKQDIITELYALKDLALNKINATVLGYHRFPGDLEMVYVEYGGRTFHRKGNTEGLEFLGELDSIPAQINGVDMTAEEAKELIMRELGISERDISEHIKNMRPDYEYIDSDYEYYDWEYDE
jgi:hypothetical protein